MDENLYRCLKQMENAFQAAIFAIPVKDSTAIKAMRIQPGEEWKMGQLIDALIWAQNKSRDAAVSVYMVGKE